MVEPLLLWSVQGDGIFLHKRGVVAGRTGFATTCSTRPFCKQARRWYIRWCCGKTHQIVDGGVVAGVAERQQIVDGVAVAGPWLGCKICEAALSRRE